MAKKPKEIKKTTAPRKPTLGRLGPVNPLLLRGGTHEPEPTKGTRAASERREIDEQTDDAD